MRLQIAMVQHNDPYDASAADFFADVTEAGLFAKLDQFFLDLWPEDEQIPKDDEQRLDRYMKLTDSRLILGEAELTGLSHSEADTPTRNPHA